MYRAPSHRNRVLDRLSAAIVFVGRLTHKSWTRWINRGRELAVEPEQGTMRFRCKLTNLKLDQTMEVKGFVIEPRTDGQERLKQASGMDTIPVESAFLSVLLPGASDVPEGEKQLTASGFDTLLLLLSFTNRSRVQSVKENFEMFDGGKWKLLGGGNRDFLALGTIRGTQIGGLVGGVEKFIDRNLEKLMTDGETEEKGLVLALQFLCSNYAHDFIESKYVKTWTALEILAAKNCSSSFIIDDPATRKSVSQKLTAELEAAEDNGTISSDQRKMLLNKLTDVHRKAIASQVVEVAERAFAAHSHLVPERKDVTDFANIRNKIVHAGTTPVPSEKDNRELGHARAQLHGLIERLVIALLDERADMLSMDWRNHRLQG